MTTVNRKVNLDLLRIIACVFVIGIHFLNGLKAADSNQFIVIIIESIVSIGLPIFFILTSVGLVSKEEYVNNLAHFYINKLIDIFFPFLIFSIFYYFVTYGFGLSISSIVDGIKCALISMTQKQQYYHLWYIYTLMGLYLFLPYLKVLLNSLDAKRILILIIVSLLVRAMRNYNLFIIGEYGVTGWMIYYVLGYYCLKYIDCKRKAICMYVLGILSFVLILFLSQPFINERFNYQLYSVSVPMYFVTAAVFLFFLRLNDLSWPELIKKIVQYVGSHTYIIYLIHPFVKNNIEKMNWVEMINNCYLKYILLVLIVFCVSLIFSITLNQILLRPLCKYIKFIIRKLELIIATALA